MTYLLAETIYSHVLYQLDNEKTNKVHAFCSCFLTLKVLAFWMCCDGAYILKISHKWKYIIVNLCKCKFDTSNIKNVVHLRLGNPL